MKLLKLVPDHTNIDFMRWRNIALVLSIIATVASLALVGFKGLNLGVDFVGGQMIRTTFAKPIDVEELRSRVGGLNLGEASIQEFGGPTSYQIRLPKPEGGETAANRAASQVRAMLASNYPGSRVDAVETVSGKVSEELARDGALAIALAMIGIAIYIWFRFEWQFGVGALVTLFHDVSMTLGFFSLTQLQVDLNVVAAILTSSAGFRNRRPRTSVPMGIVEVAAARAVSTLHASCAPRSGSPGNRNRVWSGTHSPSRPSASARFANARTSRQGWGEPPWLPTGT